MSWGWKDIVKTVAPIVGIAIGGPFGGMASKMITSALGLDDDAPESEIEKAIQNATPEQLIALKKIDTEFESKMAEIGLTLEQVHAEDRSSAREREVETGDLTPRILAYALTIGFFSLLGGMLFFDIPEANRAVVNIMLGSLGTAWTAIITYYFGSSAGSAMKTKLLGGGKK